jgi:predicted TIM-barrel fold metal-dependent hydrolase
MTQVRARAVLHPDAGPEAARQAARILAELGFDVVQEDAGGVAFAGDAERFEQVFGTPAAASVPVPAELSGVAASIVIPRRPELFP